MLKKRSRPQINAGSMADIAFLLLVFFLVATTMNNDFGIQRKLPAINPEPGKQIPERNILTVLVNSNDKILIEDDYVQLNEIEAIAKAFIENNGKGDCSHCEGLKNPSSSDHPKKAVISLQNDRKTSYSTYIAVQNELTAAYTQLRNREAKKRYGVELDELESHQKKEIAALFPLIISEAETVDLASR